MTAAMPGSAAATPFTSILVANRGEIALRIMRTAKAQGYRTIAVYSTADADARHVRQADASVLIGEAAPRKSYLDIEKIVAAAKASGAEAVHPGYGFLSENAAFADACAEAGLVFIGPSADAIRRMGDKSAAKDAMQAAGVPCVPGYQGDDQSEERLAAEAEKIGFPVMIKAVAGGGGRGMRLVTQADEFVLALRSAKSEAKGAFGDARVLLEKAITRPRHVEIQVFGDRYGNAIHLGERDCSVQRRHQKVIEEAPSPFVTPDLRQRMGAAAIAAVRAIGYEGAGTLEFLVDESGEFYFMEMNTRLQVEHPVTEAITGLDLVALQLRIAAGLPIGITQADVSFSGHAIEVRLCAEDPERNFIPQSGRISLWHMPSALRVEDALETGATVSPYYDSMVAKIVSHGATRDEARRKLIAGLNEAVILGIKTNRAFLARALAHEVFAQGAATTDFVPVHGGELLSQKETSPDGIALVAALLWLTRDGRPAAIHALSHTFAAPMRFTLDGEDVAAEITFDPRDGFVVTSGGHATTIRIDALDGVKVRFRLGDVGDHALFAWQDGVLKFNWRGRDMTAEDKTYVAEASAEAGAGDGLLRASMTGQVMLVHVAEGNAVDAGQSLVTLEAMKMEHAQSLRVAGTVSEILVAKGDQVSTGQALMRISPGGEARQ
ncbi:acetyl-CoA carboxylase biotin carboxylase subunit [Mesorhizobium sp. CAU 1732]|uniref:acetyl/propionyl/methylcrotonyl-CoA carboxylase subunit alpha n=1 Tax=Mesorhizobium sp. CAU 1732 TaxID=3140358 RepID=UPI00325FF9B3